MADRTEHCAFAVLNNNGKCVAICHWTSKSRCVSDCTGKVNPEHVSEYVDAARGRKLGEDTI